VINKRHDKNSYNKFECDENNNLNQITNKCLFSPKKKQISVFTSKQKLIVKNYVYTFTN